MRKKVVAFGVAFAITAVVALAMLVVGVSAAFNKNSVPVANSLTQAASASSSSTITPVNPSADPQTQIAQLQAQVAQYQAELNQAQQQMQSVQQLMTYLQQQGIISVDSQGNITVNVRRHDDGFGFGG